MTSLQRQSPLQRIVGLTNATSTPTLNLLLNAPWEPEELLHPRLQKTLLPKKEARNKYNEDIKNTIRKLENDLNTLVIATDSSRCKIKNIRRTGAGVTVKCGKNTISEHKYGIGRKTNVYDTESLALMAAMTIAHKYANEHPNIEAVYIFSDSSAAITNIT